MGASTFFLLEKTLENEEAKALSEEEQMVGCGGRRSIDRLDTFEAEKRRFTNFVFQAAEERLNLGDQFPKILYFISLNIVYVLACTACLHGYGLHALLKCNLLFPKLHYLK